MKLLAAIMFWSGLALATAFTPSHEPTLDAPVEIGCAATVTVTDTATGRVIDRQCV